MLLNLIAEVTVVLQSQSKSAHQHEIKTRSNVSDDREGRTP